MPRQKRTKSQSNVYHVMIRGNEKNNIFFDDEDRHRFIKILSRKNNDEKFSIYAYCLMSNHVHLVINEHNENISDIMKKINVSYVYYVNRRYERIGHLFQDRFRSEAIEDENYLLSAVRYVHNNPVNANLVKEASRYKWSSYNAYIDENTPAKNVVDTDYLLNMLSTDRIKAVKQFVEFSRRDNEDSFIEHNDNCALKKTMFNENQISMFINGILTENKIKLETLKDKSNIQIRNKLIYELKTKSTLSVRQIAELLDINRNTVQRAE